MPRVKYDVSGVETGARQVIPAGVYNAKITQADVTKPDGKDQRIELVFEIVNNSDYNGAKLYEYVNLESEAARWKLRELLEAVGAVTGKRSERGTLDTNKDLLNKVVGVKTYIRPADDQRGFDERAQVRRMFALDGDQATEEAEDFDEDVEAEAEEVAGEGDEFDDMSRAELKKFIKDEDLEIKVLKSMSDDDLRDAVREALPEEELEEEEEEEPEEEEPEAEEDEDEEPVDDYGEWSDDDLKEELSQRSLSTRGTKRAMIARLRKDDAEEDKPF